MYFFLLKNSFRNTVNRVVVVTHLMRQMNERREPMHILMEDCCPSFFTVPVFKSKIRPVEHVKRRVYSLESFWLCFIDFKTPHPASQELNQMVRPCRISWLLPNRAWMSLCWVCQSTYKVINIPAIPIHLWLHGHSKYFTLILVILNIYGVEHNK